MNRRGDLRGVPEPLLESLVAPEEEGNTKEQKSSKFTAAKRKEEIFMQ